MDDSPVDNFPPNEEPKQFNKLLWAIPLGLLTFGLLCSGCIVMFYIGSINAIKKQPAYAAAVKLMMENEEIVELLGEPIETGLLGNDVDYKYTTRKDDRGREHYSGYYNFSIPVEGSKDQGQLYVKSTVKEDVWTLQKVVFETEDKENVPGKTFRLLDTNPNAPPVDE